MLPEDGLLPLPVARVNVLLSLGSFQSSPRAGLIRGKRSRERPGRWEQAPSATLLPEARA